MSIHAHKAINHEERSYIQRILYGYEEICFSAQKAWIEFLGGTTGKHEKEQIDRLLQEKKDLEYKCKRLSEMYAKEHKNYERLEAEYRDFQLNAYDKKRK